MVINQIAPGAADDHIRAAAAIDGLGASAARNRVGAARAQDRDRVAHKARVDITEVLEDGSARRRLVQAAGEVQVDARIHHERRHAGSAVQRSLGAMEIDRVVAGAAQDDVGAAAAVDRFGARSAGNRIHARRAEDRQGAGGAARIYIGETSQRREAGCRLVGRVGEIDVDGDVERQRVVGARSAGDRGFRAVVKDEIVAGAAEDHVGAAVAVDRVRPRAAGDRVRRRRANQRDSGGDAAGVDIGEVCDDGIAADLRSCAGQVHICRDIQRQGAGARAAIDGRFTAVKIDEIGPGAGVDDVGAAVAVDRLVSGPAEDRVGAGRAEDRNRRSYGGGVDVGEARESRRPRCRLIGGRGEVEIDGGVERQRVVGPGTGGDRNFRAVVIDRVGAGAVDDDVVAAQAVDRIAAIAAGDGIRAGGSDQAVRTGRGPDHIGDVGQVVAVGVAADANARRQVHRHARRRLAVVDRIVIARADDGVRAAAADEGVVSGRLPGEIVRVARAFDLVEIRENVALGVACRAEAGLQIYGHAAIGIGVGNEVGPGAAVERVGARAGIDRIVAADAENRCSRRVGVERIDCRRAVLASDQYVIRRHHVLDDEDLGALKQFGSACSAGGGEQRGQGEIGKHARGVGDRVRPWQRVDELQLEMVGIARVEAEDPVRAFLYGVVDAEAAGKPSDRDGLRDEARHRKRSGDVNQTLEGSGRHLVGIVGIDDAAACSPDDGLRCLLNREGVIGGGCGDGRSATDDLAAGRQRRRDIAGDAEQLD